MPKLFQCDNPACGQTNGPGDGHSIRVHGEYGRRLDVVLCPRCLDQMLSSVGLRWPYRLEHVTEVCHG